MIGRVRNDGEGESRMEKGYSNNVVVVETIAFTIRLNHCCNWSGRYTTRHTNKQARIMISQHGSSPGFKGGVVGGGTTVFHYPGTQRSREKMMRHALTLIMARMMMMVENSILTVVEGDRQPSCPLFTLDASNTQAKSVPIQVHRAPSS